MRLLLNKQCGSVCTPIHMSSNVIKLLRRKLDLEIIALNKNYVLFKVDLPAI